jgi:hypothetical protein
LVGYAVTLHGIHAARLRAPTECEIVNFCYALRTISSGIRLVAP